MNETTIRGAICKIALISLQHTFLARCSARLAPDWEIAFNLLQIEDFCLWISIHSQYLCFFKTPTNLFSKGIHLHIKTHCHWIPVRRIPLRGASLDGPAAGIELVPRYRTSGWSRFDSQICSLSVRSVMYEHTYRLRKKQKENSRTFHCEHLPCLAQHKAW